MILTCKDGTFSRSWSAVDEEEGESEDPPPLTSSTASAQLLDAAPWSPVGINSFVCPTKEFCDFTLTVRLTLDSNFPPLRRSYEEAPIARDVIPS